METGRRAVLGIAFLGVDRDTPAIARAALGSFQLMGICELESADPALVAELPPQLQEARQFPHWETLLDPALTDVVVVARGADQELRTDQLRKLTQAGMTVLATHPVCDSMLVYFELDMIRRDTGAVLVPYLPRRNHPAAFDLAAMVAQGPESPIGRAEQIVVRSSIPQPTKSEVTQRFARDVDLIRSIVGDLTRLGAMVGGDDQRLASLGVQMSGPVGVAARWSVEPTAQSHGTEISLIGTRGKAVVTISADNTAWQLDMSTDPQSSRTYEQWEPASAAIQQVYAAISKEQTLPNWVDAARSVELTETIDRSLRKSRTIELYNEEFTEESTFKGLMASVGCGLLLVALVVLGAVALAETVGIVERSRVWVYLLVGVLGLFLMMQTLILVFNRRESPPASN